MFVFQSSETTAFTVDHHEGACPVLRQERFTSQLLTGQLLQGLLAHVDGNQTLSEQIW